MHSGELQGTTGLIFRKQGGYFAKTRGRRGTLHLGPLDRGSVAEIRSWGVGSSRPVGARVGRGSAMAKLAGVGQCGNSER